MRTFHRLPTDVCRRRDLTANAKILYAFLTSCVRMRRTMPSIGEIEDELGIGRATAIRTRQQLVEARLLRRHGESFVLDPESSSEPSSESDDDAGGGLKMRPEGVSKRYRRGSQNETGGGLKTIPEESQNETEGVSKRYPAPSITENSEDQSVVRSRAPATHSAPPLAEAPDLATAATRFRVAFVLAVREATGHEPHLTHRHGAIADLLRERGVDELERELAGYASWLQGRAGVRRKLPGDLWMRFLDRLGRWAEETPETVDWEAEARRLRLVQGGDW